MGREMRGWTAREEEIEGNKGERGKKEKMEWVKTGKE